MKPGSRLLVGAARRSFVKMLRVNSIWYSADISFAPRSGAAEATATPDGRVALPAGPPPPPPPRVKPLPNLRPEAPVENGVVVGPVAGPRAIAVGPVVGPVVA